MGFWFHGIFSYCRSWWQWKWLGNLSHWFDASWLWLIPYCQLKHMCLPFLSLRPQNKPAGCTHPNNWTSPQVTAWSWTCKTIPTENPILMNSTIIFLVCQTQYPKVIFVLFLPQFYFQSVSNCCPIISTMPLQLTSFSAILTPSSLSAALHHFSFGLLLRSLKWSPGPYHPASPINTTHCCHNYLPKIQISSYHSHCQILKRLPNSAEKTSFSSLQIRDLPQAHVIPFSVSFDVSTTHSSSSITLWTHLALLLSSA